MYEAECSAVSRGISFAQLMENAGSACAEIIYNSYCKEDAKILIISGKGKNGGDGFVIARHLAEKGCAVKMYLPCGRPRDDISRDNMKLVDDSVIFEGDEYGGLISESTVIVDALYGTGFKGALDEKCGELAKAVNESGKTVVSIDIPSGAECDTASVNGEVFLAGMTIAISALKPIHVMKPAKSVCGRVVIADIGINENDLKKAGAVLFTLSDDDIRRILPERPQVSNKGTFGNALCIAGSRNMPGAAKIASMGAVRSGAGLVTLAFPDAAYGAIAPCVTEQIMLPCPSDESGAFSSAAAGALINKSSKCTSCLIGCGMGVTDNTAALVGELLSSIGIPVVIDADALNCISSCPEIIGKTAAPLILTPHPGEMSRLTKKSIDEILASPVETAKSFADRYGCILVLKGANTVVCEGGRDEIYINSNGNSGLAKGGSGDLLSGIIVSLLAQGVKPFDAACAGVYIHGGCADETSESLSERGMTVTDILGHLPVYLKKFEKDGKTI